jgi:hypothetical protein
MHPHPHGGDFNMEPCRACGEKPISHTITDAEKRYKSKKHLPSNTFVWHPTNRHTHTKRPLGLRKKK